MHVEFKSDNGSLLAGDDGLRLCRYCCHCLVLLLAAASAAVVAVVCRIVSAFFD